MENDLNIAQYIGFLISCGYTQQQAEEAAYQELYVE